MNISTANARSGDSRGAQPRTKTERALLTCGIVAGPLYIAADILAGLLYESYSFADQHISELAAVGAPTRVLMTVLVAFHTVLVGAFGVGVWRSAGRSRALRWTGGLLITVAVVGLFGGIFAPMNPRGVEPGLAATLHLVYIGTNVLLIMAAIGFSAAAFGWRFRLYAIGSILTMLIFGGWGATYAEKIEAGLATPGAGIIERVSVYAWLVWLVVLAIALLRHRHDHATTLTTRTASRSVTPA